MKIHVLTHEEEKALKDGFSGFVIAAGPWVKGLGETPHRIVLRVVREEYVVHEQVISSSYDNVYYQTGNYYRIAEEGSLALAWCKFENRVRIKLDLAGQVPNYTERDQS
jgi:hypothetical protein